METFKNPLTQEEEKYYLQKYKEGDMKAKDMLIECNLRLVTHIVKKYISMDRDIEDLISIGTIGLIKAVNTFDNLKGNKLVTYASKCIDNEILMYLRSEKKKTRERICTYMTLMVLLILIFMVVLQLIVQATEMNLL